LNQPCKKEVRMSNLIQPEERVLATLNADGSRRWITPKLAKGRYWKARRAVGWALIALFVLLPFIRINGKPALLLSIIDRQFTFFGTTFYPTDTLLLSFLLIIIFLSVFLLTALFGRVWCGWGCPQTVYLEFVFRPLDRFFGTGGYTKSPIGRLPLFVRKLLRLIVFVVLSFALANLFLAYFVGTDRLAQWIFGSPLDHPIGFGTVMLVTAAMLFDFGFFREQLCMVACPYGRLQSVLLDTKSLIVGYDKLRGEPRGKIRKGAANTSGSVSLPIIAEPKLGDCVDCTLCVQVCPTGIDIRDGLQMECVHCTQCIDACDSVMLKLGREPGLIRYATQSALEGNPGRRFRPRVVIYPLLLLVLIAGMVGVLRSKGSFEALLIRERGLPYNILPSGEVANQARLRVTNRTERAREYVLTAQGVQVRSQELRVEPGQTLSAPVVLLAPRSLFDNHNEHELEIIVEDDQGARRVLRHRLLGPRKPVTTGSEGES